MYVIAGLGNPGEEFDRTRHNIGRECVEKFHKIHELPEFHFEKKWNASMCEGKIGKEKVVLLLPETFMNKSGNAIAPILRFYKIKPKALIVVHDDADILFGNGKLSFGKNSAGHKGVESVMHILKTKEFWRVRLGIGGKRDIPAEKLVLKKFTPDETRIVSRILKKTCEALESAVKESPERAMNAYN